MVIKKNNSLDNLEIVTPKENTQHAIKNGLMVGQKGAENSMSKLSLDQVLEIYSMVKLGKSNTEIANIFNLHSRYISLMRHGHRWKHIYKIYFNTNEKFFSTGNLNIPKSLAFDIMKATLDKSKTNTRIARDFGIDQSTVCRVRLRKTWKNLWQYFDNNATTIEKV
jgi:hypothetical protein